MRYNYADEKNQHLHTLEGKPLMGASTVAKMAGGDKPGLVWWAAGCAASVFGWIKGKDASGAYVPKGTRLHAAIQGLEKVKNMTGEEYLAHLDTAYKAHNATKLKKGKEGTARHGKLEEYVKMSMQENEGAPLQLGFWQENFFAPEVEAFVMWACGGLDRPQQVKRFLWCETNCYSETLWMGGIADIGYEDMEGRIVAGDHKSSKEAYFDQFIQIAFYDLMLSENGGFDSSGNKVFEMPRPADYYVVFPFGSDPFTPDFEYDVDGYREGAKAALALHKLKAGFDEKRPRSY